MPPQPPSPVGGGGESRTSGRRIGGLKLITPGLRRQARATSGRGGLTPCVTSAAPLSCKSDEAIMAIVSPITPVRSDYRGGGVPTVRLGESDGPG